MNSRQWTLPDQFEHEMLPVPAGLAFVVRGPDPKWTLDNAGRPVHNAGRDGEKVIKGKGISVLEPSWAPL